MAMLPREVIQRHLDFSGPDRIGMNFGNGRVNDFIYGEIGPAPAWRRREWSDGQYNYYDDEWGNVWYCSLGVNRRGEIHTPALTDWAMLREYRVPDLANPSRFQGVQAAFAADTTYYRLGGLPGFPFSISRYLRKMETYLQDLVLEREKIDELHEKVTALLEKIITQYGRIGADGVFFCEDWGTQERTLVSPAMWKDIYKPLYRRLCDAAHARGMHVLMHSCGYNWAILDDLAEVGVNAFQFDQPHLYGLERLAQKLQGLKVCLWAPTDIQVVLPTGNENLIVEETRKMVTLFSGKQGGFIAKNYPDLPGIGVQPEWDNWAYQTYLQHQKLR